MENRKVDNRHYYYDTKSMRKLVAAYFDRDEGSDGIDQETWNRYFKLYNETENILNRIDDPDCTLWRLSRIGYPDGDIFDSREAAERCYEDEIFNRITEAMI